MAAFMLLGGKYYIIAQNIETTKDKSMMALMR